MYDTLRRLTERMTYILALAGFAGLLVLAMMVTLDILLRFFFGYPLQGVNDVSAVVMAVVIAACIPQSLMLKQNISIEVLGSMSPQVVRLLLNLFASAAVLLFFVLMVGQFVPYSAAITDSGEKTWVLQWPVGPWWWAATCLLSVAVLAQLVVTLTDLRALFGLEGRARGASDDIL
ncbi:TRAP transporter small permease [Thalassobius sp. S69A]|uniref:TRAP transporter small permease n=1 Tax=unclassified Thalassovita TaxID=2619711 RepID=UPI003C7DD0E9